MQQTIFLGGPRADIMHENADVTTFQLQNTTSLSRMKSFTFPKQVLLVQFRVYFQNIPLPYKSSSSRRVKCHNELERQQFYSIVRVYII